LVSFLFCRSSIQGAPRAQPFVKVGARAPPCPMDWSRLHCIVIINVDRQAVTAVFGYKFALLFCTPKGLCGSAKMPLTVRAAAVGTRACFWIWHRRWPIGKLWSAESRWSMPMQPAEQAVTLACVLNGKVKMTNGNAQSAEGTSASQRPAKPTKPA